MKEYMAEKDKEVDKDIYVKQGGEDICIAHFIP